MLRDTFNVQRDHEVPLNHRRGSTEYLSIWELFSLGLWKFFYFLVSNCLIRVALRDLDLIDDDEF